MAAVSSRGSSDQLGLFGRGPPGDRGGHSESLASSRSDSGPAGLSRAVQRAMSSTRPRAERASAQRGKRHSASSRTDSTPARPSPALALEGGGWG